MTVTQTSCGSTHYAYRSGYHARRVFKVEDTALLTGERKCHSLLVSLKVLILETQKYCSLSSVPMDHNIAPPHLNLA